MRSEEIGSEACSKLPTAQERSVFNLFFFFQLFFWLGSFWCSLAAYFLENPDKNAELAEKQPVKKLD